MKTQSLLLLALLALPLGARAQEAPRLVGATASSSAGGDLHFVWMLFDQDETTTWCARDKVHVQVEVKLARTTDLVAAYVTLGDAGDWKRKPRVKQVFVTVKQAGETRKKIRHKWPDHEQPKEGKVNLKSSGDSVLVDFDQVFAGTGSTGLCISELRIVGKQGNAEVAVDAADAVARVWDEGAVKDMVVGKFEVDVDGATGQLELKKKGEFTYKDDQSLQLSGKWTLATPGGEAGRQLQFTVTKAKQKAKLEIPADLAPHVVPWHFAPLSEGGQPVFAPWVGYKVEDGTLKAVPATGLRSK